MAIWVARISLLLAAWSLLATPAVAEACGSTTGPAAETYTVRVCTQAPVADEILTGEVAVEAFALVAGPGNVRQVRFTIDGDHLLTDYVAPYSFRLPTARWADGPHAIGATAVMTDGFVAAGTIV
ncbi:MAG TPA: Ig-like domain-containing protein, partial [Actinomycetota bacterium]|nr:Ig-like domain-containing protein [Actinomycetota bacterium]